MILNITKQEYKILDNAGGEIKESGKTNMVCPRCSKPIVREDDEFQTEVRCEDINCIGLIFRY